MRNIFTCVLKLLAAWSDFISNFMSLFTTFLSIKLHVYHKVLYKICLQFKQIYIKEFISKLMNKILVELNPNQSGDKTNWFSFLKIPMMQLVFNFISVFPLHKNTILIYFEYFYLWNETDSTSGNRWNCNFLKKIILYSKIGTSSFKIASQSQMKRVSDGGKGQSLFSTCT